MFHSVSLTWGRAQSLCSTSWNWRRCFPGYFPPTGRWAEKCSVKMKYQSCPHVIYNSSLQWELLLAVFFQVSQEIMTSFFCERLCERCELKWLLVKQELGLVLMRCFCSTSSQPWLRFQFLLVHYRLSSFIVRDIIGDDSRDVGETE